MSIEKITFNGTLVMELSSKQDWISRVPNELPYEDSRNVRVWLDRNGNALSIGADFSAAEEQKSYPVRVYDIQRVSQVK